jgi:hypothetical protein
MVEHEYPRPTRNHRYRYRFTHKHHGGHGFGQWLRPLSEDDEFAVFEGADIHDILDGDGNLFGAVSDGEGRLRILGAAGEQIAKFGWTAPGLPWHGHPIWCIRNMAKKKTKKTKQHYRPDDQVFDRMVAVGLIDESQSRRLKGANHV